jgi:hypothetical protein
LLFLLMVNWRHTQSMNQFHNLLIM